MKAFRIFGAKGLALHLGLAPLLRLHGPTEPPDALIELLQHAFRSFQSKENPLPKTCLTPFFA